MKRSFVPFILVFLLGCSYAISPGMEGRADKTLSFDKLQADPRSFTGRLLILGGTIARISTVNQVTLIEVVQKPLDYWGKPIRTRRTEGRFLAFHPGFLNTLLFTPGADISLAGEVFGNSSPMTGDTQYEYPLLQVKELKLWDRERGARDSPRWIDPLYDPAGLGRLE